MGKYARIKAQTNVAISWLVETASSYGSNVEVTHNTGGPALTTTTPAIAPTKAGRLKGKARKEAKKTQLQQDQAPAPKQKAHESAYKVSTEEILRQARYLENLGQELVMSKPAWNAFKEAVRGREQYANKFANEQPEHEGNAGHMYFLVVLRRVVDMIRKTVRVRETWFDYSEKQQDKGLTLRNLFEALQDVELAGDLQEITEVDAPLDKSTADEAAAAAPSARYEPTIDPKEELRLLRFCFHDDADSIISWMASMWDEHLRQYEGGASLETASLLSDLALELLFKLEEEMKDIVDSVKEVLYSEPSSVRDWLTPMMALYDVRNATREAAGYPVLVKHLDRRHTELELDHLDDLVVADGNLVRYLTELEMEMILRYNGWEENGPPVRHDKCISNASLDALSRSLCIVTHGGCRGLKELIAANVLHGIWDLRGVNMHEPSHSVTQLANDMLAQFGQYLTERVGFLWNIRTKY